MGRYSGFTELAGKIPIEYMHGDGDINARIDVHDEAITWSGRVEIAYNAERRRVEVHIWDPAHLTARDPQHKIVVCTFDEEVEHG